ncbi:cytochrome c oxidase subunit 3 family protein [Marinobacter pelagius]|uniref:cytochrome c oxidase subunit 3 family protein n=1 Tax=Marinobacter sp. C7 TaxID=2951363 RepID=UPI001EF02467|nr:cytochrome c oxidase subunit 3 family protein [Marinobacter sp. C7]MCG7200283.1 cytochrome c oxidase subunit 3 family protein [Marinobacter sp. C7]
MTAAEISRTGHPVCVGTEQHTPGNIAVWIFIYAELTEFGFFFLAFLVAKLYFPEDFHAGPSQLNTLAGLLNTLVLLTSSFCIARAVEAIKHGAQRRTVVWLLCTVAAGVTYCLIKAWEYQWNAAMGLTSRTNYFFTSYYYLMFNHFLHVVIGTVTILATAVLTALGHFTPNSHEGLEGAASYWHMIDLVWILLFPLVYVLR